MTTSSVPSAARREPTPVRACIFDVDGLLINSEDIYTEVYNNIFHEHGVPNLPWTVKAKQQSRGRQVDHPESTSVLRASIRFRSAHLVVQGTLRLLEWAQLPLSLEDWTAKVAARRELFRKSEALPGVTELLTNLSQRTSPPVHLAVASSASKSLFEVKTSHLSGITRAFPEACRVFGHDAAMANRASKPAPDIFLLGLDRINKNLGESEAEITPGECLVFEDSISGVEAGRRAGMRVIWVPHPQLLEVCRGMEERVLAGTTEQGVDDDDDKAKSALNEGSTGERMPECGPNHRSRTDFSESGPWMSQDGGAEMIKSLQDFPYSRYGFGVSS
ncbi:MAG: Pseudouridine-5'-phosphatase [Lichina confinis]|nr:MAG: Pseudouridine-5'-phosphatase [Lichina confinis]